MVTMYDVAKVAGLSVGTVSRFISGNGYVSRSAEHAIREAIERTGYVPNNAARSLTTKRSGLLGFITNDLTNPFTAQLAQSMALRASESNYSLLTAVTDGHEGRTLNTIKSVRSQQIDGLVVTPPESSAVKSYLEKLAYSGVPVVLVGMLLDARADRISSDTYSGARAAVDHLVELGHTRIAFVTRAPLAGFARGRHRGYLDSLTEHGLPIRDELIIALDDTVGCLAQVTQRLASEATAVFAVNDKIALGILQEAYRLRVAVPEQLSVVGFDNIDLAGISSPPLTTVSQPTKEMGWAAADHLLARLADPDRPAQDLRLPCALIVRESTTSMRGAGS